jgi:hypothetical protein
VVDRTAHMNNPVGDRLFRLWRAALCCTAICLFLGLARAGIYTATGRTLDNLFDPYFGDSTTCDVAVFSSTFRPEWEIELPANPGWYIGGNKFLAEMADAATGVLLWIVVAAVGYGLLCERGCWRRPNGTRCRQCGKMLHRLAEPACPYCGEPL